MSRMNCRVSLMAAGMVLALWQSALVAAETVSVTPVSQMVQTPIVIPAQQAYCHRPCNAGVYVWNGSWGPGTYWALPRLHFHRTRCIRPD